MTIHPPLGFRWLNPGYSLLNTLVGVVIPFLRRRTGAADFTTQPSPDLMTVLWLAFGLFQLGIIWIGLCDGQAWALWVVAAAVLGWIGLR